MNEKKYPGERLLRCIAPCYGIMMGLILFLCIFCTGDGYACKRFCEYFLSPFLLLPAGVLLLWGLYRLCTRVFRRPRRHMLLVFSVCLFLLQVFAVYSYYFRTGWDVQAIVSAAERAAHGSPPQNSVYFSRYPNNLFLTSLFSLFFRAVHLLGLHDHEYVLLLCGMCFLNMLSGALLALTVRELFHEPALTAFGWIVYVLLIGLSPWASIPYSDSCGLFIPILTLYLYVKRDSFRFAGTFWLLAAALSWIGCKVKPQLIFAFVSVVIVALLSDGKGTEKRNIPLKAGCALLGLLLAVFAVRFSESTLNMTLLPDQSFGTAHYLMMGFNPETCGIYSSDDVAFSASFDTKEERTAADLAEAKERIRSMGVSGVLRQLKRKTLTNYTNGTFAWGVEGSFFLGAPERGSSPAAGFFRSLYYFPSWQEGSGSLYPLWANLMQMLWLSLLLLGMFSLRSGTASVLRISMLSIMALSVFEAVFEARARYLYVYAPVYVLIAVFSAAGISRRKHECAAE